MRPGTRLQHVVAATVIGVVALGLASATASAHVVQSIGTTGPDKLVHPTDVALGPAGTIYVLDMADRASDPNVVDVYASSGRLLRTWRVVPGNGGGSDIAVDQAGNVYLAVSGRPTILKYSPTGQLIARWRVPASGDPHLDYAGAITVDPRGNVLVAEGNGRLETFDGQGQLLASLPGVAGAAAVDGTGVVYVADRRGIAVLDASGKATRRLLTRLTFTLSEDSSLRIVIKRRAATTDRRNRYFGRYMHLLTLDRTVPSGRRTFTLDWRTAGSLRRAPGDYQLTLVARDDAGNESGPARLRLIAPRW
jgi:hypothetical protein